MSGMDWDNFEDDSDDDFLAEGAEPVEAPKACSISDEGCEACQ